MPLYVIGRYYQLALLISLYVRLQMFLDEFHIFFLFDVFGVFSMQFDELVA
jgi:hypothetical protein